MLVLSRRRNEACVLEAPPGGIPAGTLIRIVLVDVRGDKARLGFEAPKAIPIDREEVHQSKKSGQMPPRPNDNKAA